MLDLNNSMLGSNRYRLLPLHVSKTLLLSLPHIFHTEDHHSCSMFICSFGDDTCAALQDFEQCPQNSSLDTILPCGGTSNSNKALMQISYTTHNFINKVV